MSGSALTLEERYLIHAGTVAKLGVAESAKQLRRHLVRPARRPWNGSARPIQERGDEVWMRHRLGHWEADTMVGKKKDKQRLLVMYERHSLYMSLALLTSAEAWPTARTMKRRLERNGIVFQSVTTDRGSEFGATGDIMDCKAFVCDAHCPNQRGTNENQIGMLRRDLPKGMTMDGLTSADVRKLENKYNHTPRKCLGFRTPSEVAFGHPPRVGTRT
jgi:transposase, IS30 family